MSGLRTGLPGGAALGLWKASGIHASRFGTRRILSVLALAAPTMRLERPYAVATLLVVANRWALAGWALVTLADVVEKALAIARRTGARVIIQDARLYLDKRLSSHPPDQFGLTRREREVVDLVAAGASNTQVATALGISPATVRKHLEHAYEKLDVSTRTAAAARTAESRPNRSAPSNGP